MKKKKSIFIEGPVTSEFIGNSIAKHQSKTSIGGHEIFLGQVRADQLEGGVVESISFTAYEEMAEQKMNDIREKAFDKFDLTCMHVYHSLGNIAVGEICFFVFASSPHRKDCRNAVAWLVDTIKKEVPVFGKELLNNGGEKWKSNNPVA